MNVAMTTPDRRATTVGESTITVKWWAVFMAILSVIGFLFMGWTSNNSRITRLEEKYDYVVKTIGSLQATSEKIEVLVTEIRLDQQRRQAREK
jgi:hypothetical protein